MGRGLFGCSREHQYHYSPCTKNNEHGSESMDGSNIVEGEFHVNNLFWLKVSCINCFPLGEVVIVSINILCTVTGLPT